MVFGRNGVSPPKFLSPVRLWTHLEAHNDHFLSKRKLRGHMHYTEHMARVINDGGAPAMSRQTRKVFK